MKLYEILEHLDDQTSSATTEKAGIVKFGTETGNAIDAETWKQAIGQSLGGYVSKVENKEAGKWYINDLTDGKIYKCIQTHTSTSFDITKFVDITNVGLSDKVENLCKSEILTAASFAGYFANYNKSEWFVPLPSHINIRKIIAVTCFNLMTTSEYANLDYNDNVIRVGGDGNLKDLAINTIKVLVTYNA